MRLRSGNITMEGREETDNFEQRQDENVKSGTISDIRNITINKSLAKQKEKQKMIQFVVHPKFARQNF